MYNPARGDLLRWLLTVTHHAAVDGLRSRRGTARNLDGGSEALNTIAYNGEEPSESAWRHIQAESVRAALAELPPPQREALELAYYGGLSQSEIAARTGQPLGTVKTRIRLGMVRLREALDSVGATE